MILSIDTTLNNEIELAIKDGEKIISKVKFAAPRQQSEKLLPAIDKLLEKNKIKLSNLTSIEIANRGGSFTSLRIGVITANALGYALGIPVFPQKGQKPKTKNQKFSIVKPIYDREPNITIRKK